MVEDARVLIVDDSRELLALVTDALRAAGYCHIDTAESVRAAHAAFDRARPDIMVLDINLPDGDGFTLLQSLRR